MLLDLVFAVAAEFVRHVIISSLFSVNHIATKQDFISQSECRIVKFFFLTSFFSFVLLVLSKFG